MRERWVGGNARLADFAERYSEAQQRGADI
jgi:hypothetical protein